MEISRMLVRDPRDAVDERAVDASPELDGRAVRTHEHVITVGDPAALRVGGRKLDVTARTLEAELRHALEDGPREERRVAMQPKSAVRVLDGLRGGRGSRSDVALPCRK